MVRVLLTPLFIFFSLSLATAATYNVVTLGAKGDGTSDSTNSFLSAWRAACDSVSPALIYVPPGKYLVGKTVFSGVCKSSAIDIHIDGTLLAPADYRVIGSSDNWLMFEHVTGVSIYGGGTLDGQGTGLWACKASGQSCPMGTTVSTKWTCKDTQNKIYPKILLLPSQKEFLVLQTRILKIKLWFREF